MNYFFYEELGLTFFMLNWILVSPNNRPELVRPIGKPSPLLTAISFATRISWPWFSSFSFSSWLFVFVVMTEHPWVTQRKSTQLQPCLTKFLRTEKRSFHGFFFFLVFPTVCISIEQIRPGFQKICMSLVKGVRKKLVLDMKRCSGSLVISKMQIKTTTNSCFISSSLGKVKEIWQ